jgi:hypothetical protein
VVLGPFLHQALCFLGSVDMACSRDMTVLEEVGCGSHTKGVLCCPRSIHLVVMADWTSCPAMSRRASAVAEVKVVCKVAVHLNRNQILSCCLMEEKPSALGREDLVLWMAHEEGRWVGSYRTHMMADRSIAFRDAEDAQSHQSIVVEVAGDIVESCNCHLSFDVEVVTCHIRLLPHQNHHWHADLAAMEGILFLLHPVVKIVRTLSQVHPSLVQGRAMASLCIHSGCMH